MVQLAKITTAFNTMSIEIRFFGQSETLLIDKNLTHKLKGERCESCYTLFK